ncbi:AMP-binding protein [Planococcus shixiaomingii]|uniref:AMP-binding protein n=1 Tax=Planococcus shixiaomingii TaxID=3058393 RepID=UPI00262EB4E3|nr:AMP-binding protein [Planococcus sp. N022]WKA56604.1 AMP-binding protein [Planococcus sp. N022]
MVFNLLGILSQLQLLSPLKLMRLASAIRLNGVNLMLLFSLAGKDEEDKVALVDSRESFTYKELHMKCENLAFQLKEIFHLKKGQKVAFLCKNHASFVQALFAVSRLGADSYLLNTAVSKLQMDRLITEHDFDLLVYDNEFGAMIEQSIYRNPKIQSCHREETSISFLSDSKQNEKVKLVPTFSSKIVLLTSGTTGKPKKVIHRPSLFNFLQPFAALLQRLHLTRHDTAYIATPIFHGYGIAILLSFFALGKKVVIQNSFDAFKACSLIRKHHVEVITVVPLMIHKMLMADKEALRSLACIASGGAKLNPVLVEEVNEHLGEVLFNLYGTSEAGLNIIATPEDLKYDSNTLGKLLAGGRLKIVEDGKTVKEGTVGHFCMRNKWSMTNRKSRWIETGDLGYRDPNGYYFLSGRKDDLIISAGNNIYPLEVEGALTCHPCVEDAAVIGIKDVYCGQILQAFVQLYPDQTVSEEALANWLRKRVADYQIPRKIVFVKELPYTAVGKLDRKSLEE